MKAPGFHELVKMIVDGDIAELERKMKGGREAIAIPAVDARS